MKRTCSASLNQGVKYGIVYEDRVKGGFLLVEEKGQYPITVKK